MDILSRLGRHDREGDVKVVTYGEEWLYGDLVVSAGYRGRVFVIPFSAKATDEALQREYHYVTVCLLCRVITSGVLRWTWPEPV
jgi:hypothetical protein